MSAEQHPSGQKTITLAIWHLGPGTGGDPVLAQVVVSDYFLGRLAAMLAHRFPLRGEVGAEDVANSALRVVIEGSLEGFYSDFDDRDAFWDLLATVAVRKALNCLRKGRRVKHGGGATFDARGLEQASDPRPGPEWAALVKEEYERLVVRLPDDLRQVAEWKARDGLTNRAIAAKLGCSEEAVRLKVKHIRSLWKGEQSDE
jgi:DNA-directed RNA polymerase specialized sigma24 family protein